MAITLRRRSFTRLLSILLFLVFLHYLWPRQNVHEVHEIKEHGMLDLVPFSGAGKLDVHRHKFLQARMGRDERPDIFDPYVKNGLRDYWDRFQKP
jgi:hypothetical protein